MEPYDEDDARESSIILLARLEQSGYTEYEGSISKYATDFNLHENDIAYAFQHMEKNNLITCVENPDPAIQDNYSWVKRPK